MTFCDEKPPRWRVFTTLLVGAILLSSGAAIAQGAVADAPVEVGDEATEREQRVYLEPDAFRALFEGKTIHVTRNGEHYGSEYYKPGDRTVWIADQGPCRPGVWYYEAPQFCFRYGDDGPHCWTVFRRGDAFYAESTFGVELKINAVEERPLSCDPELLS